MANIDQVISHIRFGLDQLSARNAHHEFEHLCRHLTRLRICSNVLPATGPVGAGGDQGRDFETFRTYLRASPIGDSSFVGVVLDKPIAFACSLKKQIATKIKSDVGTITGSGSKVEAIHYFCSKDIPTANRHKLKAWALNTHQLELEIHDGQSIAELLSERDVFWIAERYLSIPGEIYPRSSVRDGEGWYNEFLKRCKESPPPLSYANFFDVKLAARNALTESELRQDLPFWIDSLKTYASADLPTVLKRRAVYEVSVLSIKGLGTLEGQEDDLRRYFIVIPEMNEAADIEDAAALLNFCSYACSQHRCELRSEELLSWHEALTRKVDELLKTPTSPTMKAHLLDERGYLSLSVFSPKPRQQQIDEAFGWWMKLMAVVDKAPLFPLDHFADRLTQFIGLFNDVPAYHEITRKVDTLLSKRFGSFTAAEKCRDRAIALHKDGKMLGAINQLHQSKINWFAAETLEYSLLSMLLIAQCYQRLGLVFAAKYYALAVASIALHSPDSDLKRFIPRALEQAAESDYQQGAWFGLLGLTDIALMNHHFFAEEATDISAHTYLHRIIFFTLNAKVIVERIAPNLLPLIDNAVDAWQLKEFVDDLAPLRRETWPVTDIPRLWANIEHGFSGTPFNDLGERREAVWAELGVAWRASWANDHPTTSVAEGFVAFLQILLADLVGVDLCLLKSEVSLDISLSGVTSMPAPKVSPSDSGRAWQITFPESVPEEKTSRDGLQQPFMATALAILLDLSLISTEKFERWAKKSFRTNIRSKLLVAQPYELLYREFVDDENFAADIRRTYEQPGVPAPFAVKEYEELPWYDGPGPGYSKSASKRWVKNRYKCLRPPIALTLELLKENNNFLQVVGQLRSDGWLDWHILSAVNGIALNYKTAVMWPGSTRDPDLLKQRFGELLRRPERLDDPAVPLVLFTEDKMREQLRFNMMPTLKQRGLESHQRSPDMQAIDHFLRHRYNYWTDDVEHDLLPWDALKLEH
jgi:hypothetical protein